MNSVALVIVMLLASHANSSPVINFSWDTPRHFCGSQLANVLALICRDGYNFHPVNDDVTVPSRRRKRVPIVEECCENTCTPHHLKAYCWENQRSDVWSVLVDPSVDKPSVDKRPQRNPAGNALSQRQAAAADNGLLLVERTTAKTKSNSIITDPREPGRPNNVKYNTVPHVPKKEAVIVQDPVLPGRVKTVTPYFDKMPSVIITKTQH